VIDFTKFKHVIECNLGDTIRLKPFGDVHFGSPSHHKEKWREFCEWAKCEENNLYLGMGDFFEGLSESEMRIFLGAKFHNSTIITWEEVYGEMVNRLYEQISFMKGKVIGLLEGNHTFRFQNGTTSTQRLCALLGCKYLGYSSFIRLSFRMPNHLSVCLDVYAHHGVGGGSRKVGASLNMVQFMSEVAEAQLYLMAHDHAKISGMRSRLYLQDCKDGVNLRSRKQIFARTGSFLKGYEPGKANYVSKRVLAPSDLGTISIKLTPQRKVIDGFRQTEVDMHVSL